MITKDDGHDAYRVFLAEGRKRLGPPPTPAQIDALTDGRLSEDEAARVRELLIYYPELTPFEMLNTSSILTDAEMAEDREQLRRRIFGEDAESPAKPDVSVFPAPPRQFPRIAVAAVIGFVLIAIGVAATYLYRHSDFPYRNATAVILRPDGQLAVTRGAAHQTPHQLSTDTVYRLRPLFRPEHEYRRYDLELFDRSRGSPRSVWKRRNVERARDGSFPATLSTADLAPGRYELVLYGIGERSERLATYSIRLMSP